MKVKNIHLPRVIFGIVLGFVGRVVYEQIRSSTKLKSPLVVKEVRQECAVCHMDDVCPLCPPTYVHVKEDSNIAAAYKPRGMYEVNRWLYFDDQHVYDIINEEPKVELTGYWREEIRAATHVAMEYVNVNNMLGQTWSLVKLHSGYMRTDSSRGTDFMLDLLVKPTGLNSSSVETKRIFRISLVHPLEPMENAHMLNVNKEIQHTTKIVVPISSGSEHVADFIDNYVANLQKENVELILVLFTGSDQSKSQETKETVLKKTSSIPSIKHIIKEDAFNYFSGIHSGAEIADESDIILAIAEDTVYTSSIIHHCNSIAVPSKRAYFPVAFAQFDRDIIERGMPPGKPKNINKKEHSKFTGYWMHETHNYVCAYKSDLMKVLSTFKSMSEEHQIKTSGSWVYDAFLQHDIEAFSAVEPDLFKLNNKHQCDNLDPLTPNYKQCHKRIAPYLGSKPALGILYINEVIQKSLKTN